MVRFKKTNRKAISPIIATVLIIAVTLIAAVAIAGFVFGVFSSSANTAQVAVTGVIATHGTGAGTGTSMAASCSASSVTTGYVNVVVSNTGTAPTSVTGASLTIGGQTFQATVAAGCVVGASGGAGSTQTVGLTLPTGTYTAGEAFNGYITTSNGAQVLFTGTLA